MSITKLSTLLLLASVTANAAPANLIRWTVAEDRNADFSHVLDVINQKTGAKLKASDFLVQDDRDLAFSHYTRYEQQVNGDPIEGKSIRIWTDLKDKTAIQVEALVETKTQSMHEKVILRMDDQAAVRLATRTAKANRDDPFVRGIDFHDAWKNGELVRVFKIKGKRGKTQIVISHRTRKVIENAYEPFPQADLEAAIRGGKVKEKTLNALVYPIYEELESNNQILSRVPVKLTHIAAQVPQVPADLYAPLQKQTYAYDKFNPTLGESEEGRALGFWSMSYLKRQAAALRAGLPQVANTYSQGLLLQGRYATINIHPEAFKKFQGINFTPKPSAPFFPNWDDANEVMIPSQAFFGKPLMSAEEVLARPANRYADHDPAKYMNDGFDEIQVYYAINTLMESLQGNGFTDPDLSTRPFNAFLFNPDIAYRDNAFYTDDTINFTTYSAKQPNMARDNSTIWHELGHGVMDRLMGDNITLADTGGLSEGMADFCAAMVIADVTKGVPFPGSTEFRIINHTGFNLTNEVHDDGEAYGGTMKSFMDTVMAKDPKDGLRKVVDVVLETMRLTRDHPGLTASDWFNHMLFADHLGRPGVRSPDELSASLLEVLAERNFHLDGSPVAEFKLVNEDLHIEVAGSAVGTRNKPNQLKLAKDGQAVFHLSGALKSSKEFLFQYPVTVKVLYNGGPLQGAVHWVGEENGGSDTYVLNSEAELAQFQVKVTGTCDEINREDGSCVDFAYVQIFNKDQMDHPVAKKRFYVQIRN